MGQFEMLIGDEMSWVVKAKAVMRPVGEGSRKLAYRTVARLVLTGIVILQVGTGQKTLLVVLLTHFD